MENFELKIKRAASTAMKIMFLDRDSEVKLTFAEAIKGKEDILKNIMRDLVFEILGEIPAKKEVEKRIEGFVIEIIPGIEGYYFTKANPLMIGLTSKRAVLFVEEVVNGK